NARCMADGPHTARDLRAVVNIADRLELAGSFRKAVTTVCRAHAVPERPHPWAGSRCGRWCTCRIIRLRLTKRDVARHKRLHGQVCSVRRRESIAVFQLPKPRNEDREPALTSSWLKRLAVMA